MVLPNTSNGSSTPLPTRKSAAGGGCCSSLFQKRNIMLLSVLIMCLCVIPHKDIVPTAGQVKQKKSKKFDEGPPKEPYHLRPDGYRICQAFAETDTLPALGEPIVRISQEIAPLPIPYQCKGPKYDAFGDNLQSLMEQTTQKLHKKQWGRRPAPIPPHAPIATNDHPPTFVLFMGSSALRQIVAALLCQYSDLVLSIKHIYGSRQKGVKSHSWQIRLRNNIHVFVVINPPFVYHDSWLDLLERHILNMPLAMMDIIVLSKFTGYTNQFGKAFEEFWMDHENDWTVPDTVHPDPINIVDFLVTNEQYNEGKTVYEGPILYVSLFAPYGKHEYGRVTQIIDALQTGAPLPKFKKYHQKMKQLDHEYQKPQSAQQEGLTQEAEDRLVYRAPPPKVKQNAGGKKKKTKTTSTKNQGGRRRRLEEEDGGEEDEEEEEGEETEGGEAALLPQGQEEVQLPGSQQQQSSSTSSTTTATAETQPPKTLAKRTNLMALDARKYVEPLGECATESIEQVSTCITDEKNPLYSTGPRCFGNKGGHADLIAWEVIEAIHSLIWKK